MYSLIRRHHLLFEELGALNKRGETALHDFLTDQLMLDVIDTRSLVLDSLLSELMIVSMNSVISYVKQLLEDFIIAYVVFAVALSIAIILLIHWSLTRVKRSMWDTNIILKILPFETLAREEREEIKNFFKQ